MAIYSITMSTWTESRDRTPALHGGSLTGSCIENYLARCTRSKLREAFA